MVVQSPLPPPHPPLSSIKKFPGILVELHLIDTFVKLNILTQEHGISFPLFESSVSFKRVL